MKHDKFGSRLLVWVSVERLRTDDQEMLKLFFELAQPQWLLFTYEMKQKEAQNISALGEEKYIGRMLKGS